MKFETLVKEWFSQHAELTLKKQTLVSYEWLSKRVIEELGHMRIDKITTAHIQKFVKKLTQTDLENNRQGKLSPKTVRNYLNFVSTVFEYAMRMKYVGENPCRNVTNPKNEQKEKEIYTIEEVKEILRLLPYEPENELKYVVFILLSINSGLRRGEILGLEWSAIDFENNTLTVRQTSYYAKQYGIYTDTPKSKTSYRTLKLPVEVMEQLRIFKQKQAEYGESIGSLWTDTDRLFTSLSGTPMHPDAPRKFLVRFCQKHGIRFITLHNLRHLYATVLLNKNIDIKTVSASLGHSNATTTLNIYSHTMQSAQDIVADVIANTFSDNYDNKPPENSAPTDEPNNEN
jgi:integrase